MQSANAGEHFRCEPEVLLVVMYGVVLTTATA
jgi:hypothetical protein